MLAIAVMALATASQPPLPMATTGPWIVDGEEDLCILQRDYGSDKGRMTLAFKPLLDLDDMELYVVTGDKSTMQYSGDASSQSRRVIEATRAAIFRSAFPTKSCVTRGL